MTYYRDTPVTTGSGALKEGTLLPPAPPKWMRNFTVHFQYFAEIEPHTFRLRSDHAPTVAGGVLRFCTIEDTYYEYNWDLIAHTTLTKEPIQ